MSSPLTVQATNWAFLVAEALLYVGPSAVDRLDGPPLALSSMSVGAWFTTSRPGPGSSEPRCSACGGRPTAPELPCGCLLGTFVTFSSCNGTFCAPCGPYSGSSPSMRKSRTTCSATTSLALTKKKLPLPPMPLAQTRNTLPKPPNASKGNPFDFSN